MATRVGKDGKRYPAARGTAKSKAPEPQPAAAGKHSERQNSVAGPDYYAIFGEFIHSFSTVENCIHELFRHYLGTTDDVARCIDGDMRLSNLIDVTKRIIAIRAERHEIEEIESIFSHLNHIIKLRNMLIHRGGVNIQSEVLITNLHIARSKAQFESLVLHLDDIKAATRDCSIIYMKIRRLLKPNDPALREPGLKEWLDVPWRYKPRQPERPNQPPRTTARSQKRRPRSSQE